METLKEQKEKESLEGNVLVIKNDETNEEVEIPLKKVPLKSEREEMKLQRKIKIITFLVCLITLAIGIYMGLMITNFLFPERTGYVNPTEQEIVQILENKWLYKDDYEALEKELLNKSLIGMTSFENDPYTIYMEPTEMETFSSEINMNYVGVGIQYTKINDSFLIRKVFKDSPAEKAGIQTGDLIISVADKDITNMTAQEVKDLVIGEPGSTVKITISRYGQKLDFEVERGNISHSSFLMKQDDVLYLELSSFGDNTADEIMTYMEDFPDEKKIIIDLRDNTGGYQSSVEKVAGLFIGNDKVLLRQKDVNGKERVDKTIATKTYDFDKIVIIVNENTASAAEVLAICLKEQHPNVTLVGTTTYGKGVIQQNLRLKNGGYLKITTDNWYSPNGVSIDKTGITPDIEVRQDAIHYTPYKSMKEEESCGYDSVSEFTKIAQIGLKFVGYDVLREDGYMDKAFLEVLHQFESDINVEQSDTLTPEIYERIIAEVGRVSSLDRTKDNQYVSALLEINK